MKLRNKILAIVVLTMLFGLNSCQKRFFPNVMFKEEASHIVTDSSLIHSPNKEYLIQRGDKISFKIYSNDGFVLVDQGLKDIGVNTRAAGENVSYTVNEKGYVRLPIIDSVRVSGKTVPDVERLLEKKYSKIVQNPFVTVKVESWRVFVFKGLNGTGQVIPIEHQNTSLLEIIAISGGIPTDAKAYRIKVIRGEVDDDPQVFLIDASSLTGLKESNIQILSNDIIYIEPMTKLSTGLVSEISPYVNLITLFLLVGNLITGG